MTEQTTPEQARIRAHECDHQYPYNSIAAEMLRSLAGQVEALTAAQNKCGFGPGCLYKDALIDSLTEERDAALKLAADRLVDVERYQWLRSRVPGGTYRVIGVIYSDGGAGVDAAIDAAMQAAKEAQ